MQTNVVFGDAMANAREAVRMLEELKKEGVQLAVFPEAYLTGYAVDNSEQASDIAIRMEGELLAEPIGLLRDACQRLGIIAIVGLAASDDNGLLNAAMLFEPGKSPRRYAKVHLPDMGLDKFVRPGNEMPVFDTAIGRIGILICFDMRPPEAARVLSLKGADIIVLPTNWPEGASVSSEHICIARAAENRVYFLTCNRVGTENGFTFIGRSKIIDPTGKVLAEAAYGPEVITADLDLEQARQKRTIVIPGRYEIDVIASRRPELYGILNDELAPVN